MAVPAWLLSNALLLASMALAFVVSAAGTRAAIAYAQRRGILDHPGQRRSHAQPTPRGGGAGIVLAITLCGVLPPAIAGDLVARALGAALLLVAAIGWVDDHRPLSAVIRLIVHLFAAVVLVGCVSHGDGMHWIVGAAAIVAIVWSVNLHNFIDGIDGLLSLQTIGFFLMVGVFAAIAADGTLLWLSCVGAAATSAFVPFNLPRAQIFLGDVGSGALGFLIGAVAFLAWRRQVLDLGALLMLTSASVADATATLAQRVMRGRRWWRAHNEHLYQWLTRSGHTHLQVSLGYFTWTATLIPLLLWARTQVDESSWAGRHRELADSLYFAGWPVATFAAAVAVWIAGRRYCLRRVRNRM